MLSGAIMFGLGMTELLVILLIAVLIFGAKKLPQIGEGLGKGIRNFRKSLKDETTKSDKNQIEDKNDTQ